MKRWEVIEDILAKLGNKPLRICEVGVYEGKTAKYLLNSPNLNIDEYIAVDSFKTYPLYSDVKLDVRASQDKLDEARKKLESNVLSKFSNARLIENFSYQASQLLNNEYFDFIFIDANHSYKHVIQDIEIWLPKVKSGGYLAGHDFEYPDLPDVKHAVDEILGIENIKSFDDYVWFYRK